MLLNVNDKQFKTVIDSLIFEMSQYKSDSPEYNKISSVFKLLNDQHTIKEDKELLQVYQYLSARDLIPEITGHTLKINDSNGNFILITDERGGYLVSSSYNSCHRKTSYQVYRTVIDILCEYRRD